MGFLLLKTIIMKLKNKSKITRSTNTSKHNFTPISNVMIQGSLSLEAIGLLTFMISLPETWVIYKDNIRKMCKIGRTKFDRIWKECADEGYIKSERMRNDSNQFTGWSHMVSDNIIVQKPNVVKPDSMVLGHSETDTVYKRHTGENIQLEKNIELPKGSSNEKNNSRSLDHLGKISELQKEHLEDVPMESLKEHMTHKLTQQQ